MSKCKTFKIGVFFDGTNNNMEKEQTYSNIAKLYKLYDEYDNRHIVNCDVTTKAIYMQGIGASDDSEFFDGATGGGGAKRINDALEQTVEYFNNGLKLDESAKFIIDVFGFSRGAALARDYINTFYKKNIEDIHYQFKNLKFNFIGLFDTVGSFGVAGNDIDFKPIDPKKHSENDFENMWIDDHEDDEDFEKYNFNLSTQSASKIVHLVASNELRENFPLTTASNVATQIELLGVHSDIGGGYGSIDKEILSQSVLLSDFEKREQLTKEDWIYDAKRTDRITGIYKKQRFVKNSISDIYLFIMYKFANEYHVPLKKLDLSFDDELLEYFEYINSNIYSSINYTKAKQIKDTHIHQSANHPAINTLAYELRDREGIEVSGNNVVNIINAQPKREIYSNFIHQAII